MRWPRYPASRCAGIVVVACTTERILLLQRSDNGLWENPGGHLERGESFRQAALREFREETGYDGLVSVGSTSIDTGSAWVRYECFFGSVEREFEPVLTEHIDYRWAERGRLPSKMVSGAKKAVEHG